MSKKYELVAEKSIEHFGRKLFRIRALISFGVVEKGEEGGYIQSEKNLSQEGDGWVFKDAKAMDGGAIMGGAIWGGTIMGGTIWGGNIWGGTIMGGTIWGGNIWGGTIWGGTIWGGNIWGGTIMDGDIRSSADIFVAQNVGSEYGVLTAVRQKDGTVHISRGCFIGTLEEFRAAVTKKHGGTLHEKGYLGLANYIEWHFTELHPFKEES